MLFLNIAESGSSNGEHIEMKEVKECVGTKLREHDHNELRKFMYL